MNLPMIHKRELLVQQADAEIGLALAHWEKFRCRISLEELLLLITEEMKTVILGSKASAPATIERIRALRLKAGLTDIEYLQTLTSAIQTHLKYALRYERHRDYSKPAGLT